MSWIEPLNLGYWLINVFAGSVEVFMFLMFIFIAGLAAYFRMSNTIALVMLALFGVIFSLYFGGIYVIILLIGGIISFYSMSKIAK